MNYLPNMQEYTAPALPYGLQKQLMKAPIGLSRSGSYCYFMQCARHFVMGVFVASFLILLQTGTAFADQVAVHYRESTAHGLFSVKSLNGKEIGKGELTETVEGGRVSAKLTLTFSNGSLYEETTHFTQDGVLRLLDYHMLQRGPSFKETLEMTLDAAKNVVIVRCSDGQDGRRPL